MLRKTVPIFAAAAMALSLYAAPAGATADIAIGAGDRGGAYYALGRGICRLLNREAGGENCSLLPSPRGDAPESYSNLVNVHNGAADFGLARSDWQHYAFTGTGPMQFTYQKLDSLRSVFSLHSQPVTLVARRDAGIAGLDDLKGKRVNIGPPFTSARSGADLVMQARGWSAGDFALAEELTGNEQGLALCHDRIQAVFLATTHPDDSMHQLATLCDAALVSIAGAEIDELVASTPYLTATQIAGGTYPGMAGPVATFGATVTLVTSENVDEEVVYGFVKTIFENIDELKKLHPSLNDLDKADMTRAGLSAPLHPGAERYYREQGLM